MNFYETLRFEVKNEVGITVATHGWIGTEMIKGKFMMEEGVEMQWKEEREVSFSVSSSHVFLNYKPMFLQSKDNESHIRVS